MDTVVSYLRSPQAIRDRANYLFEQACHRKLTHFRVDLAQLEAVARYVVDVTRVNYPDGHIPVHARWRHFETNGESRLQQLQPVWHELPLQERVRASFDLVIVSVLLDAGAGPDWRYMDASGRCFSRSEGLAVASFDAFAQGRFSSQADQPWRVDAAALQQLRVEDLAAAFQVSEKNPLVGLEGRCRLLQTLGRCLSQQPDRFGERQPRLGYLADFLAAQAVEGKLPAAKIFSAVLSSLGDIWPGRVAIAGVNLGDVWPHPDLPDTGPGAQLVPFHKLSQWLTYSLLEPLQLLGLQIVELDALTGLAEYRNGGLCLDLGLLVPQHPEVLSQPHAPASPVIVEWRALTVAALDRIAESVRAQLQRPLSLPEILQGGTWAAGRQIARRKRPAGTPPIQLISDGTVF
ncbi:MAG: URC4/urg3 family protein [Leptolyngbya sp. SIO4C1]|nr:URC4/urg3 family protein [Leptolyngbya sp. SIO4C1]